MMLLHVCVLFHDMLICFVSYIFYTVSFGNIVEKNFCAIFMVIMSSNI